jgi:ABC-type polysaccharide/polyol phosphate transport system ATPase subunit
MLGRLCRRALWLEQGELKAEGGIDETAAAYIAGVEAE